jgi:barbiturase
LPEDIGRLAMVEKVAEGVKARHEGRRHLRSEGCALRPDQDAIAHDRVDAGRAYARQGRRLRGARLHGRVERHDRLGIAVALGEIAMPKAEEICRNLDLYSSVASCSSGVELDAAQIVLLGNKADAGGRYRIGHSVMKDALDIDGIYDAIRDAGLELPERPRASDLKGKLVNCFMKCEADKSARLRGRRQIMLDDSDVHHHRHSKAAVGGVAAAAIGDPAVFVSVDAMHQGPHGGGPVIAIVDVGE